MLLQLHFHFPPGLRDYEMSSVRAFVCACMCVCHIFKSFIIEVIFIKFAENVYGCENMSVKTFVLVLKNNMAAIADCSKIIDMF